MKINSILTLIVTAGLALAQESPLITFLQTNPDLSTLLDFVQLVPGLADTLANSSNITIIAPSNSAFENVPSDIPEGQAIANRNVTSIQGLLSNHVFRGYYPSASLSNVPTFAQTLLNTSLRNDIQPFTEIPTGQYNGLVLNGGNINVLSGELTVSQVTQGDIMLSEDVVLHVVDTALSFAPPLQLFTARDDLLLYNGAVEAADLPLATSLEEPGDVPVTDIEGYTFFIPNDAAFESIGSVLETADQATLREVLEYHIIPDNIIFSPSLANTTVTTLQGNNLTVSVLPDGSVFIDGARITLANIILSNGVGHIVDSVLSPDSAPFDRETLQSATPAIAFPGATAVTNLPLTGFVSFTEALTEMYTTPVLLQTVSLVNVSAAAVTATAIATSNATSTVVSSTPPVYSPPAEYTGGAVARCATIGAGMVAAAGGLLLAGL